MMELLSPAGSAEAVIAAVQNGADSIYMGFGITDAGRNEQGFSQEELAQSLRYCRVRGCHAAVAVNELVTDDTLDQAVSRAVFAARQGAEALLVQDIGLISVLRQVLPDMPLWGGVRMGIRDLDGVRTAAAMGVSRVMLAPELTREQIRHIAGAAPIETAVCVHGPMCFSHMGQCLMSAMAEGHRSDSVLRCAEQCRGRFSLGGRMDDRPMSIADVCLIDHLAELEEAGVCCAVIGGRSRRPEYVAYVTDMYARAIHEKVPPAQSDREELAELFAPYGLTDAYYTGAPERAVLGAPQKAERSPERAMAEIRKRYMDGELRRVPITFYAVIQPGRPAAFAVEDRHGRRAVYEGYAPVDLGRQGITDARVREILFRTGGTPYDCVDVKCAIAPDLDYPDEALEQARRALLARVTEQNREPPAAVVRDMPAPPAVLPRPERPAFIVEVRRADQITAELAASDPDWLYAPAEVLAAGQPALEAFRERGASVAAVLPIGLTDEELPVVRELLMTLRGMGIHDVLVGSPALIPAVLEAGMLPHGDQGLNITNSRAAQRMAQIGLRSVTASVQLSARQIARMAAAAPTEMIVYGRVPVMLTEQCLIRGSSGRCSCGTPTSMSDPFGNVYPVEKAAGCRNIIYDGRKIFLADRPDVYEKAGLWGARLMFTTESARECADVAGRYRGRNTYEPNNIGRGLYPKGAL